VHNGIVATEDAGQHRRRHHDEDGQAEADQPSHVEEPSARRPDLVVVAGAEQRAHHRLGSDGEGIDDESEEDLDLQSDLVSSQGRRADARRHTRRRRDRQHERARADGQVPSDHQ
jgi:hypothetical protein